MTRGLVRATHASPLPIACSALVLFLAAAETEPSAREDELARRTFANAEQLMLEGKIEQALRDFSQVSTAYPESSMADDALYRVASYYYPVETVDALGSAGSDAIGRARGLLEEINLKHPREDSAPLALLKLGLIALDPANPERDLDEAYASFFSIVNIYPDSGVVDRALLGAGYADLLAGNDKSITSFERVVEEFASSPVAEDAHFYMGMAYLRGGSHTRALEEFQAVKTGFPDGRLAPRAQDRLTQIYKMKIQPDLKARPLFAQDARYSPAAEVGSVRGPVSMAVGPDSVLHLLDQRVGATFRLAHDGALASTGPILTGAVSVSVSPANAEILAAGDRVRLGTSEVVPGRLEGAELRRHEGITAAVRSGPREFAVLDSATDEVLLYEDESVNPRLMYRDPSRRSRLAGLAPGAGGRLYTIDQRGKRLIEIAPEGTHREIPFPVEVRALLKGPDALAADDIGTLFILDRRAGAVFVMTAEGRLLQTITSQPDGPGDFSYASAIAVGPRAEIYIYDDKRKTILRFW